MSYVSVPLRRLVTQRAEEQCEYCRYPQAASFFTFEIEHIIDQAIKYYINAEAKGNLRQQIKQGALRRAEGDLEIAQYSKEVTIS